MALYSTLQMPTTIQVSEKVRRALEKRKQHPRDTYEDVIVRMMAWWDDEEDAQLNEGTKVKIERSRREHRAGKGIRLEKLRAELGL